MHQYIENESMVNPHMNHIEPIENQTIFLEEIEEGAVLKNCEIDSNQDRKLLSGAQFINCVFLFDDFSKTEILDCSFSHCEFSNFNFEKAILYRDMFTACKLLGTNFIQAGVKDTQFSDCLMTYVNFSDSKLTNVKFESNKLNESSFQHVQMKKVSFNRSYIDGVDFSETALKDINLSSCEFTMIRIDVNLATGLKINQFQAASLISSFGIKVVD
ncbi:MAG: type secretion system effector PipB2 [Sporolactobacillus laevolacticus]|nr:type secretion system effector PipB2 [Sporolactobacillus laevolacticus]